MSSRLSGALVLVLAFALAVSGCSGGDDDPREPAASSSSDPAPSTSAYGDPAFPDAAAVYDAVRDYNTRNNADIRKAGKAPFRTDEYDDVDLPPLRCRDAFDLTGLRNDRSLTSGKAWVFDTPASVYQPVSTSWPKLVVVAAPSHPVGTPARPGPQLPLTVFSQEAEGAALMALTNLSARRARLPQPLAADEDHGVDPGVQAAAVELARALGTHWSTGAAAPGFAGTGPLDEFLHEKRREEADGYSVITNKARLVDGDGSVTVVPVQGGVLTIADYRVDQSWRAASAHSYVFWKGTFASVYGGQHRSSMHGTWHAVAAWMSPEGGAPAQPVGFARAGALF